MSGHSRWAGIKHKKGLADAKRGKLFTKIIREIAIAAKISGGNPEANPRLRKAMDDARDANMPADNIKKAIQRGTGELPGTTYEELVYEGYGPSGVALTFLGGLVLAKAMLETRGLFWPWAIHAAQDVVIFAFLVLASLGWAPGMGPSA